MRLRIATWNMSHWQRRAATAASWHYLLDDVRPDVALVQEAVPPEPVGDGRGVLDRIAAFGLVDCLGQFHTGHVQTQRHPRSPVPWQNDYLYVSQQLRGRVVACDPVDEPRAWELSQHCPVVADLEL